MNAKIYTKISLPLFCLFLTAVNVFSQAPPITTVGPSTLIGVTVTVPVTVTGFTNVGDISLRLNYDATKLVYTGATLNTALSAAIITPTTNQSGVFRLSFTSGTAVVLANPTNTLLTLTFTVKAGVQGERCAHIPLTWSTAQGDCDITPPAPGLFSPEITVSNMATYFINGFINVPPVPVITGPGAPCDSTPNITYSTLAGMNNYLWTVSAGGNITNGTGTNTITVYWITDGPQTVSVTYSDPLAGPASDPTVKNVVPVALPIPTITGPLVLGLPAVLGNGITDNQVYSTETGMMNYIWTVSTAGTIKAGQGSASINVKWTDPTGQQLVTVTYTVPGGCMPSKPAQLIINYNPFPQEIDPTTVKQFVDPLPHFAAGLRVNAKAGGHLVVKAALTQQVGLSTGTLTTTGIIDPSHPEIGRGNYAGYAISTDNGATFGPTMWPAQTIEAQQGNELTVEYKNELTGVRYSDFNILADQTLMLNGYQLTGNPLTDPYTGDIPMVVHLHGGEMPSNSDGGPTAWFTPGYKLLGPGFLHNASSLSTYPNKQEATTLWYHPHDQGLTRINVYTGLAGYYFLRGPDEEAAKLPGWSGDDKVQEVTPAGKVSTFNGSNTYLPEIEVAIQDRMFNVKGELFWPVNPTNPDIHPFWTPEFFGDLFTVNGKTWPYLSVAPRKYRFRFLDGCNARFLNMWLKNLSTDAAGPVINVIGTDGGLLDNPIALDPTNSQTLFMAPGERFDVVVDFSGIPNGTVFTLMNNAAAPYPTGDPVVVGTTDRIMQFVVNGNMVASGGGAGTDKSLLPSSLRPAHPMVKLTDFSGNLSAGVTPDVKRQIILNEITAAGGPAQVLFNNSHFDTSSPIPGAPPDFGGPTELPREGTVEQISIINTTVDAHPIHIHLLQWQLVKRQAYDVTGFMNAYDAAWAPRGLGEWPAGLGYPGGSGSPLDYNTPNTDGAVGGNPAITPFLTGPIKPADPDERGWKDDIKSFPGEVATYIVRIAPTDKPIGASQQDLLFPFDPSIGPGFVWHCHIIDHEDMDMMRPLMIQPSFLRFPKITTQPEADQACVGDDIEFSVIATSATPITYQWQISTNGGTTWTNLTNGSDYSGVTTAVLHLPQPGISLSSDLFRCVLTNIDGVTNSNSALLTVTNCSVSGTVQYNNAGHDPLAGMTVIIDNKSAVTDATGAYTVTGVSSKTHLVTLDANGKPTGGINSTDAGWVNYWFANPHSIENVRYLAGDVNNDHSITAADAQGIQRYFVLDQPFGKGPWVFWNAIGSGTIFPPAFTVTVDGQSVANFNILGMSTGDFNGSFSTRAKKGLGQDLQIEKGDLRKVSVDKEFELPIRSNSKMQVGAISLILNIPSDLVEVTGVYMKGSKTPVTYNVRGNELRIGWNSLSAVDVQPGDELLVLKMKATPGFTDGVSLSLDLDQNPLNELADKTFMTISDAKLKADVLEAVKTNGENLGDQLVLSNYPNPAKGYTTVYYTVPFDGMVTMNLYNALGEGVNVLVNESKTAGRYSLKLDASSLPQGMYMVKLKLHNNNIDLSHTIKIIVNN